ncbi:unnamed protein product [Brachionus calyciflorus]|uniref:VWFA domain-containing protein n=1 Tax=Brachionus calyciflorus TaxID=104777 RepID=A0A814DLS9_9BILA|nr:unnamed protein product [Brachionus calyciflorus]
MSYNNNNNPYLAQDQMLNNQQNRINPQYDPAYMNSSAPPPLMEQPPPYQMNHSTNNYNQNLTREQKFSGIISKHEISQYFAGKLQLLNMFKIVFVFDDSGSMNAILNESPLNNGLMKATRWNELEYFAKISIEIANIFNENGTDVFFLNRPMARNVCKSEDLIPYFQTKPSGYTPIARVLQNVLQTNNQQVLGERKLLIILVTDGEPTNDNGQVDIQGFKNILKTRGPTTYTTIVSCTDEENTMDYLNNWDRTIPRLDVVDDFRSERDEVKKSKGSSFSFSFGDYVVKSMIGSIDPELDRADERPADCCMIL